MKACARALFLCCVNDRYLNMTIPLDKYLALKNQEITRIKIDPMNVFFWRAQRPPYIVPTSWFKQLIDEIRQSKIAGVIPQELHIDEKNPPFSLAIRYDEYVICIHPNTDLENYAKSRPSCISRRQIEEKMTQIEAALKKTKQT